MAMTEGAMSLVFCPLLCFFLLFCAAHLFGLLVQNFPVKPGGRFVKESFWPIHF